MSDVSVLLADNRHPPAPGIDAQKFLRDRITQLEKQIELARERYIVPLQNELEPLQHALAIMTGTTYEGLGTLAAVRKLLIDRKHAVSQEEIAMALVAAGFKYPRTGRDEIEEMNASPLTPEQRIMRSIARFVYEGELAKDEEGRVILPEWKKKQSLGE